jgi:hypothetical protein
MLRLHLLSAPEGARYNGDAGEAQLRSRAELGGGSLRSLGSDLGTPLPEEDKAAQPGRTVAYADTLTRWRGVSETRPRTFKAAGDPTGGRSELSPR